MQFGKMNLTTKDLPKVILFAVGLISVSILNFSWVQMVLWSLLLFSAIVWSVSQKLRRQTCHSIFKYVLIGGLIFAISFSACENYMLRNAGYPPTFESSRPEGTISYPNILNTVTIEILQGIKNTPTFKMLSLEYPGENTFLGMELNTRFPGMNGELIQVRFEHASKFDLSFTSYNGNPYTIRARLWSRVLPVYIQSQTVNESLQQIDDLGLQWFYDHAIEEHQNRTGIIPEITVLKIMIIWDDYEIYQGLTVQLTCSYESMLLEHTSFMAVFQPDGTALQPLIFQI
jgi:hypothetical protein